MQLASSFSLILIVQCQSLTETYEVCRLNPADVVFVMDQSGSVGSRYYRVLGLERIQDFVDESMDIGFKDAQVRVGVVLFDDAGTTAFGLDTFDNKEDVLTNLGTLGYSAGDTDISSGMEEAINVFKKSNRELKIMIIITDGSDESDVAQKEFELKSNGVNVYAIGVGPMIEFVQLVMATGSVKKVFKVSDYNEIGNALNKICLSHGTIQTYQDLDTNDCGCSNVNAEMLYWLDLTFVMDSSKESNPQEFFKVKDFIREFAGKSAVTDSQEIHSQIAVINTGNKARIDTELTRFSSVSELNRFVDDLEYYHDHNFNAADTMEQIRYIYSSNKTRKNVPKVVVFFSSENITCKSTLQFRPLVILETDPVCFLISQLMKENGITFIEVSLQKHDVSARFVSGCNLIKFTESDAFEKIFRALCYANCFCETPYSQQMTLGNDVCSRKSVCLMQPELALPFDAAEYYCHSNGMSVYYPQNSDSERFVIDHLQKSDTSINYWLGMISVNDRLYYSSSNDSFCEITSKYENWCPDAKRNDGCVSWKKCNTDLGFGWDSDFCGAVTPSFSYICQHNACSVNNYCPF
uniref:VWFA domain-containing protein n=1 Tax=Syphacia muris TaxID=451379 RepID=A0A0N5AJV7_9BILA